MFKQQEKKKTLSVKSTNRQVRVSLFYCSRCTYRHARSNHYVNQWINPPWCLTFFHYGHLWTNGQCQTTTSLCLSANLLPVFLKSISSAEGCTCVFPLFSPVCLFLFVPPAPTIHSPTEEVTERGGGGGALLWFKASGSVSLWYHRMWGHHKRHTVHFSHWGYG